MWKSIHTLTSGRIRHVKCDEGKPDCARCTSTGRTCDGYPLPKGTPPAAFFMVVATGSDRPECDSKARSAFRFFCEVCAPFLADYGTHALWNSLVPQACHSDESIKHLVIATSSLRSQQPHPTLRLAQSPMFLIHYGKALRLLSQDRNLDTAIILIACILLIICDMLQQKYDNVNQHLLAGRRIIAAYHNQRSSPRHNLAIEEITSAFSGLELRIEGLRHHLIQRDTRGWA